MHLSLPIQIMPYRENSVVPITVNVAVNVIFGALLVKATLLALNTLGISVATAAVTTLVVFSVGSVILAAMALYTCYLFCDCLVELCNEITSCFHTNTYNAFR